MSMSQQEVDRFWGRACMSWRARRRLKFQKSLTAILRYLTSDEEAFVQAAFTAATSGRGRWDGQSDIEQMAAVVRRAPSVVETIGSAVMNVVISVHGAAPAVQFLIDHDVPFSIDEHRARKGAVYDIFSACGRNDLTRLRTLGAAKADIHQHRGEADMTPLHWAARVGTMRCASWLLSRGAAVDAETVSGRTPLHLATDEDYTEMIWLLAGRGADLNAADSKGRTPLHRATYCGNLEAAEVLIVLGANVSLPNRSGKTPLEVARKDCLFLKER